MGRKSKKPPIFIEVGDIEKFIFEINFQERYVSIPRFVKKDYYPEEVNKYLKKGFSKQLTIF